MSARDDYQILERQAYYADRGPSSLPGEALRALDEIDRLRRWKAEALEVLKHWDAVTARFDLSGHLGEFEADAVGAEIDRLRERIT